MINAILINPTEANVKLIQIKDDSKQSIDEAMGENRVHYGAKAHSFINPDDLIHNCTLVNEKIERDFFTMLDLMGNQITIYGNGLITGMGYNCSNDFGNKDVKTSIADLVGEIEFFKNTKTIN